MKTKVHQVQSYRLQEVLIFSAFISSKKMRKNWECKKSTRKCWIFRPNLKRTQVKTPKLCKLGGNSWVTRFSQKLWISHLLTISKSHHYMLYLPRPFFLPSHLNPLQTKMTCSLSNRMRMIKRSSSKKRKRNMLFSCSNKWLPLNGRNLNLLTLTHAGDEVGVFNRTNRAKLSKLNSNRRYLSIINRT